MSAIAVIQNFTHIINNNAILAHPIDPSALECCSKMYDSDKIDDMIQNIDFNDLFDDNYFSKTTNEDPNKGNI